MTVSIRTRHTHDQLATHRRTMHVRRGVVYSLLGIAGTVGLVWLAVWLPALRIRDLAITGTRTLPSDTLRQVLETYLDAPFIGVLYPHRNIALVSTNQLTALVQSQEGISQVTVTKEYPHTIRVQVYERTARGSWCRGDTCTLFDREGSRWGIALPSRGALSLTVFDERERDEGFGAMLTGVLAMTDGLASMSMRTLQVRLPNDAPGDIRITTDHSYEIIADALGDSADQLETLGTFLAEHATDASFAPVYLDLRTPGRVYYR